MLLSKIERKIVSYFIKLLHNCWKPEFCC